MAAIVFSSTYGSTERYARELAARVAAPCMALDDAISQPLEPSGPVVVLSPNYGGQFRGVDCARSLSQQGIPTAFVAVGMTPLPQAREKDQLRGVVNCSEIARFYLPGRLAYSELSRVHRATMWTMTKLLRAKPSLSVAEQAIVDGYGEDISRIDFAELAPIEAWLRAH
ncbi:MULTISPECIES: flavodoxin domain-containing protein [unclassified Corynebacterium]|uniref:flavodoxin domain-containing protein n=1 Tax=unclassified Corynebacterium TaxID=2624378 RepID=UPI001C4642E0|nr:MULTISPECIES: flavodoxin domain-containing protein [unclassified Corynebacterium]MBV7281231.1 flavodoxin domain-containing protein [Corynebacterium sp. TAE3-ERU30]MBV7301801.1 flavodoxin domain-containing protein [Corynebacterium sp. TAE3-ERU2]